MMMMTFITQGGEGQGKTNKKRKLRKQRKTTARTDARKSLPEKENTFFVEGRVAHGKTMYGATSFNILIGSWTPRTGPICAVYGVFRAV